MRLCGQFLGFRGYINEKIVGVVHSPQSQLQCTIYTTQFKNYNADDTVVQINHLFYVR